MATRILDAHGNFRFKVTFTAPNTDGGNGKTVTLGMHEVDGLKKTVKVLQYREGSDPTHPIKIPGQTEFGNVTFKRGVAIGGEDNDVSFLGMFTQARSGKAPFRYTVTVEMLGADLLTKYTWKLLRAFTVDHAPEKLTAMDGDVLMHTIEVAFEDMEETDTSLAATVPPA